MSITDPSMIIAIVALFIGIGVWARTKRPGPVIVVAICGFIIMAISDPAFITTGGDKMKDVISWAMDQITTG